MKPINSSLFQKRSSWQTWSLIMLIPFIAIVLMALINSETIHFIDQLVGQPVIALRNPVLTNFFILVTDFGGTTYLSIIILLTSFFLIWKHKDYKPALWLILQSFLGAAVLNQGLKIIFHRSRPMLEHLVEQGGYSFPSGHSMGAMICYGGIIFLLCKTIQNKPFRISLVVVGAVLIFMIGLSRIYVGVHYSTDVIGGFSVGGAWLAFTVGIYPRWQKFFRKKF